MDNKYYIPIEVMRKTREFLVEQGKKDREAYVLWKGLQQTNLDYKITGIIVPEQKAIKTSLGYAFDISLESIAKVITELRQLNEIGLIQVHSHPGRSAIHSERDDKLSLLGRKGALSVVLPFFGNVMFDDFSQVMVHMLTGVCKWELLSPADVKTIMIVVR